ncbi:MAG TPA: DUF2793 domain-containing protein, partial [Sphingomonadaceae bacterium]|nr:DUF2793 domain-containing protein [Sphingomonadaceae bacterium]
MTDITARFALPLLQSGQAQKELFHNEALALIDALLHPVAEMLGADTPPAAPEPGQCWIVGAAPSGDWAGRSGQIAAWTAGGWRFAAPATGMTVWLADANVRALYDGSAWREGVVPATALQVGGQQVVGERQSAIADPAGG